MVVFWIVFAAVMAGSYIFPGHGNSIPGQPSVAIEEEQTAAAGSKIAPRAEKQATTKSPRIVISKLGVNMPVVEGKTEKVLLKGAWRSPWGSTPDKGGNTILFGHRYLHKPPHPETFFSLDTLGVGDTFEVLWEGKTYTYKVFETKVVEPTEISVLRQTDKAIVTLITCTPLYTTKQRLVVVAELVK